jgi:hypothetical protein
MMLYQILQHIPEVGIISSISILSCCNTVSFRLCDGPIDDEPISSFTENGLWNIVNRHTPFSSLFINLCDALLIL